MENDRLYMGPIIEEEPKKEKNKLNIEKSNEKLRKLEEITIQIYDEIKDKKEISIYKIQYLLVKLDLIQAKISEILNTDNYCDVRDKNKRVLSKIILVMCLGGPFTFLLGPIPSILVCFTQILLYINFLLENKNLSQRYKDNTKEYFSRLRFLNENFVTCEKILREKVIEFEKRAESAKTAQQQDKFLIANNIIVDLVNKSKSKYIDENLSQEVCNIMRKILQDDLKTDETNLSILLDMAREKNDINNLQGEIGLKKNFKYKNE